MTKKDRRTKEGRGQGAGAEYAPYNKTQDMNSRSNKTRCKGWKTGRVHSLATQLHLDYFYVLEFAECVIDIQEEFPLPIEPTLSIAHHASLNHPVAKDGSPTVVTTDFYVTVQRNERREFYARAIQTSGALNTHRHVRQLDIQRLYFETMGIDWGIITEIGFPKILAQNVRAIHAFREADGNVPLQSGEIDYVAGVLTQEVQAQDLPLSVITNSLDERLGLKPGCCISLARHLIASQKWRIDMYVPFNPAKRLTLLGMAINLCEVAKQ